MLSEIYCGIDNISSLDVNYSTYSQQYTSFDGMCPTCTWIVPYGSSEDYKARPWWIPTWEIAETTGINDITAINYKMEWNDGKLTILSSNNGAIRIYAINGILIQTINAKSGETYQVELPRGMYIINNKKVMLK